ncbi:MAG: hypothetical protein EBY29_00840 [Planctomycetes bacterium]|nr:hypothetical protein [Planctomycetota bacterium]
MRIPAPVIIEGPRSTRATGEGEGAWLRGHVWIFAVVVCEDDARDEVEVFIYFLGSQTSAIQSIATRGTATETSRGNA